MESSKRYIDAENDIYPPPSMTSLPSEKVTGFNKIYFAMMYFQLERVKYLLSKIQQDDNPMYFTIFDKNHYGENIILLISRGNFPSNIDYNNNKKVYEELFLTVLENIKPHNLIKLYDDLFTETLYGTKQIDELFSNLSDRPHMILALWNYGLRYTEENIMKIKYEPIKYFLKNNNTNDYTIGKKYITIMETCPLSLCEIENPAMLPSGHMFEYDEIKNYLAKCDNNPLTNIPLTCESQSIIIMEGNEHVKTMVKIKILYLPKINKFEHFK